MKYFNVIMNIVFTGPHCVSFSVHCDPITTSKYLHFGEINSCQCNLIQNPLNDQYSEC